MSEIYAGEIDSADREKKKVALSSVLAAIFIAAIKVVIGVLTNSLGILAEAAHSGLDLIAAGVTFFAVRLSSRPPDPEHPYGHGKIENLSALIETFLLLVTCIWIIYSAVDRLFFKPAIVEVSVWSFVVMIISVVVNISRSRALMKVAKKHGSQALEADALHFETDVWSSYVVIGGLLLVAFATWLQKTQPAISPILVTWLFRADSIAALGVSGIVVYVSIELGKRTIDGLLDRAPLGMVENIEIEVKQIPGVINARKVRTRPSGPYIFVDLTVDVARSLGIEQAHDIASQAQRAVFNLYPRTDVVVHVHPAVQDEDSMIELVRSVAGRKGVNAHSVLLHQTKKRPNLEMHIEVPEALTLAEAHELVTEIENLLRDELPNLGNIVTHIEPAGDQEILANDKHFDSEEIRKEILVLPKQFEHVTGCHGINMWSDKGEISVSFHCDMDPQILINEAHSLTTQMEQTLRIKFPEIKRVIIHSEPQEYS
jgi:cation diffusion facilitator family transporter